MDAVDESLPLQRAGTAMVAVARMASSAEVRKGFRHFTTEIKKEASGRKTKKYNISGAMSMRVEK